MSRPLDDPPVCDCHGEPKLWRTDKSRKSGGHWRCSVKQREYRLRWSEANRDKILEYNRRYRESPHGRLNRMLDKMTRVEIRYR